MKRKHFLAGVTGAAAAAALPRAVNAQQFVQQFTIAINAPLSGPYSLLGKQLADGALAAVVEENQTFLPTQGAGGTGFAIRPLDDGGTLAQAIANIRFAAADPTVIAVIGGPNNAIVTQTVPQYSDVRMPLLVPASTADGITARGYRNVWRLPTKDSSEGSLLARYVARKQRPHRAIAIAQDIPYGPDVARGFTDQMNALKILGMTYTFPAEHSDYSAAAREVLAKQPDYLYLCGTSEGLGPIAPALRSAGYAGALGASEGFFNQQTTDQFAAALEGALVSTSFPPLDRATNLPTLLPDFRARTAVTALSAFSYAAAQIVMDASRRAGGLSRLSMLTALRQPIGYDTIVGPFLFNAFGDPIDPNIYLYAVRGGKISYVEAAHPTSFVA